MKKYLKTIEEVSDALAAGKVVYDENGSSFKLDKNGIIVSESESFGPCVGAMVDLNTQNYILESEPFKIEVGKFYKTRGGEKARCFSVDVRLAYFIVDEKLFAFSTYLAGNVFNSKAPCKYDIIGLWEE